MELRSGHRVAHGHTGRDGDRGECQPARVGWPHHTEHLCAGFMGEFLGQWKTRPNSSNCETLPRTLPGEGGSSEPGTPCSPHHHCHTPLSGQHPIPCPRDAHPEPAAAMLMPTMLCTAPPDLGRLAPPMPPNFGAGWYL